MISFGKPGALIVCVDVNREFENDGLYIDGMNYEELCRHDGLQKKWQTELKMQGRDYAFGIRAAHVMRQLGLEQVEMRVQDMAEFVTPQLEDYEQIKQNFLASNGWDKKMISEDKERIIQRFVSLGASRREAEEYCQRNEKITAFFADHPDASYTFVRALLISFGKKGRV